jgi:hypothetical protein
MPKECAGREGVVAKSRQRAVVNIGVAGVLVLLVAMVPATSASAAPSASVRGTPSGSLLATLNNPGAPYEFGYSVAVSGKIAVVGAPYSGSTDAGVAYIYVKGASGWPTTPTTTLSDPGAIEGDSFGYSVAVSGKTVVIGAQGASTNAGVAYIYVEGASGWPSTPTAALSDPGATAADVFGTSVATSGRAVLIGAPGVNSYTGAAYIYVKDAAGWPTTPTTTLSDPQATAGDVFGTSVAVWDMTAVVGADQLLNPGPGAASYIYVNGASGWPTTPTATLSGATPGDLFGFSVAVWGPDTKVVVGAPVSNEGAGAAYIYQKSSASVWPTTPTVSLSDPNATGYEFGYSVAVSGKTAIVGAIGSSDPGAAYAYVKADSVWPTTPTFTLSDPGASASDEYGYSVALAGKTALVGAPQSAGLSGATYIYEA